MSRACRVKCTCCGQDQGDCDFWFRWPSVPKIIARIDTGADRLGATHCLTLRDNCLGRDPYFVNHCLKKIRKGCNDLVPELHNTGAVSDELLLHTTVMKWKDNSCYKNNGASDLFRCNTTCGFMLTHFSRKLTSRRVCWTCCTLIWKTYRCACYSLLGQEKGHQHFTHFCIFLNLFWILLAWTFAKLSRTGFIKVDVNALRRSTQLERPPD